MKFKLTPQQKAESQEAVEKRIAEIKRNLESARILIWTEKGGEGKSSIATALALEFDFSILTNEPRSPLLQVLPEGEVGVYAEDEEFPHVPDGNRIIWDCKGAADGSAAGNVGDAARNADVVIIPVRDRNDPQLYKFLESMKAMMPHNPKIIMVANACKRGKFPRTSQRIQEFHPGHPLIEIKETTAFDWMMDEGKSLSQLIKDIPLGCSSFAGVRDQILGLAEVIAFEVSQPAEKAA